MKRIRNRTHYIQMAKKKTSRNIYVDADSYNMFLETGVDETKIERPRRHG